MRTGHEPRAWYGLARWSLPFVAAGLLAGCAGLGGSTSTTQQIITTSEAAIQSLAIAGPPVPPAPAAPDMTKLRTQLQEYLDEQTGTYGVYLIDLTTGASMGINADTAFPAASTFKLPMSLYILDLVAKGKASLDEELAYTEADYEDGTGTLQDWIGEGEKLPVRDLIELAITQSDNIATQMLLRRFGASNVYEYMHQLGGTVTHYDDGVVGTTPREMANYMRDVQTNIIQSGRLRRFLLNSLENTAFDDRTAAGVPNSVALAHKIGTLPNVVNDVALVEVPGHPFVIAAFSMDVDDEVAPNVIAEVTRQAYEFLLGS